MYKDGLAYLLVVLVSALLDVGDLALGNVVVSTRASALGLAKQSWRKSNRKIDQLYQFKFKLSTNLINAQRL